MSSKNALLTGASGFLGRYVFQSLEQNYAVDTIGRTSGTVICDLSKEKPKLPDTYHRVVHVAGLAHIMDKKSQATADYFGVNHQATINLLEALEQAPPTLFVFISTVAVYGLTEADLVNEESAVHPTSAYGESKLSAEKAVIEWCRNNKCNYVIFRLPLIIGKNAPGNMKRMVSGIKSGKYFDIGKGNAKKSMVLAQDVADLIASNSLSQGVFNLTDGQHPSMAELSHHIAKLLKTKRPLKIPNAIAKLLGIVGDILPFFPVNSLTIVKMNSTLTFDDTRARKELNWQPARVLETDFIS